MPALALAAVGVVGCSDKFDTPPMVVPHTDIEANITIFDLKKQYWNDDRNYIDTIGLSANGDSLYIKGRIVSSDESGNIYKALYIQDETGALCMSIDRNNLYNEWRVGQEVIMSVSGMYIGKYNGLQQFGQPEYTEKFGWEAAFMNYEFFKSHARPNGLPDVSKIDTVDIDLGSLPASGDELIRLQGQLVRLRNVHFPEADGMTTFSDAEESTNRTVEDADGNTIIMRNSSYADFQPDLLPMGNGDIIGILGFYGEDWQLLLRSTDDLIGFTTDTNGTEINPYTIEQAIELQGSASGWVTGYIVGAVAPEVTTVTSDADIEWAAPTTLGNTIVIGMTADTRSFAQCIVMELPQGSALQNTVNLAEHPEALGTQIWVKGKLENYMGTYGLTGNSGAAGEFKTALVSGGEGSLFEDFENVSGDEIPDTWTAYNYQGDKDWFINDENNGNHYASMTGFRGTQPPFETWLVSPALDIDAAGKKVFSFDSQIAAFGGGTNQLQCFVMTTNDPKTAETTEVTDQINWASGTSGYSDWTPSGDIDLSNYTGTIFIGFRYYADPSDEYDTWSLDNFRFGIESGTTPDPGPGGDDTPISATRADFETFGTPSGYYNTFTSSDGWVATNCSLLAGSDDPSAESPYFQFIGYVTGSTTEFAYAPCMNGNTSRAGTIVSPTISGGCGELTFNFGIPFNESDPIGFRVDIKQNGSVVKTFNVEGSYTKGEAQSHTETINVNGDFTIEFVNLSPSQLEENKNRVCIWNVSWTNY